MFNWYMKAKVCYVYLTDVATDGSIHRCRWFRRGWTLQELIAPKWVKFYDGGWNFINDKISISSDLARITGIDEWLLRCGHSLDTPLLEHHKYCGTFRVAFENYPSQCSCGEPDDVNILSQLKAYCVAEKMSWASNRETTRNEDMAYCLMGLFQVNMPLLYGEGRSKAFFRLQREILENTHDQSILAMDRIDLWQGESNTALATRPDQFPISGVVRLRQGVTIGVARPLTSHPPTADLTKFGVSVEILVAPEIRSTARVTWFGILECQMGRNPLGRAAIPLHPIQVSDDSSVVCIRGKGLFGISPEHPHHARAWRVLLGWEPLKIDSDREKCRPCAVIIKLTFQQAKLIPKNLGGKRSQSSRILIYS